MRQFLAMRLATVTLVTIVLFAAPTPNTAPGMAVPVMQRVSSEVYVARLSPRLWVHTTIRG